MTALGVDGELGGDLCGLERIKIHFSAHDEEAIILRLGNEGRRNGGADL